MKHAVKFFSELSLKAGENTSKVQILKTGRWNHPVYGDFSISASDLDLFVQNFNDKVRGTDLCVDVNHDFNHKAIGWFRQVERSGNALFATIEWNAEGVDLINSKTYRYFSPELFFTYRDEESGRDYRCVLIGGGITNRPFFKGMEALKASESESEAGSGSLYFNDTDTMPKFKELAESMEKADKVDSVQVDQLRAAFSELSDDEKAAEKGRLEAAEKKFSDQEAAEKAEADKKAAEEAARAQEEADAKAKADAEAAAKAEQEKAALAASENVESQVFKETGMKLSEIREMQKRFSEMEKAQKFADTEKRLAPFVFGESSKEGFILPRAKDAVLAFSAKLPDALAKEFFDILSSKPFRSFVAGEAGKADNADAASKFSVPEETPSNVTRDSFVLDFVTKKFMEQGEKDHGRAMILAQRHIKEHGIK